VIRVDGFYPLALEKSTHPPVVFLFGSALFATSPATVNDRLVLNPAPNNILPSDSKVALITRNPSSRDTYRIGVGVDLISVVKRLTSH
jgi:hypothetical protein